jgi:hypothetical protein
VFVPGESPVKVYSQILDIVFLGELCVVYIDRETHFSLCGECIVDRHRSVSFYSQFLNKFWIASRSVCSFCEAMAGSLSEATTAVSSAKVAVVDSGEVARSAVYSRYNNGHRTLPWSTPALTGKVQYTQFRPLRGSICYINRILG